MLLSSTTEPLPAHRPWSGGSMSATGPAGTVGWVALSTASSPTTPLAPPLSRLMAAVATDAGAGSAAARARAATVCGLGRPARMAVPRASSPAETLAMLGRVAFAALTAAAAGLPSGPSLKERVLGVTVGPVSRSQPDAQPVAAGPVKVGLKVPRLAEVTLAALAVPAVAVACAGRPARPQRRRSARPEGSVAQRRSGT